MIIINLEDRNVSYTDRLRALICIFGARVDVHEDCVSVDGVRVDDVLTGELERWLGRKFDSTADMLAHVIGALGGDESHPSWQTNVGGAQ